MSSQPQTINSNKRSNETGFDFPLSPTEPGKFDFYRVHLNNQQHKNDSMYSDNYEVSNDTPKHWSISAHMKHLSEQPKTSSLSTLFKSSDSDSIPTKTPNRPIQTVASFSSLTDAVKNAMQRGTIKTATNPLQRPATNRSTVSSKDLNHLSPQSM